MKRAMKHCKGGGPLDVIRRTDPVIHVIQVKETYR